MSIKSCFLCHSRYTRLTVVHINQHQNCAHQSVAASFSSFIRVTGSDVQPAQGPPTAPIKSQPGNLPSAPLITPSQSPSTASFSASSPTTQIHRHHMPLCNPKNLIVPSCLFQDCCSCSIRSFFLSKLDEAIIHYETRFSASRITRKNIESTTMTKSETLSKTWAQTQLKDSLVT